MKVYYLTLSQVFPSGHRKAGLPTNFVLNILKQKLHTIRGNYDFWAKRFKEIEKGNAVLSIRVWVGKPYGKGSFQREILRLSREDGIGLQRLRPLINFSYSRVYSGSSFVDVPSHILAKNDGLSFDDWIDCFKDYDLTHDMAIIHFTTFRYR